MFCLKMRNSHPVSSTLISSSSATPAPVLPLLFLVFIGHSASPAHGTTSFPTLTSNYERKDHRNPNYYQIHNLYGKFVYTIRSVCFSGKCAKGRNQHTLVLVLLLFLLSLHDRSLGFVFRWPSFPVTRRLFSVFVFRQFL